MKQKNLLNRETPEFSGQFLKNNMNASRFKAIDQDISHAKYLPLNKEQIEERMYEISRWCLVKKTCLRNEFHFKNINTAKRFFELVHGLLEEQEHPSDIILNKSRVIVSLFSSRGDTLTEKDFTLAKAIDALEEHFL